MFSPELMKYIIQYQQEDYIQDEKEYKKNDEIKIRSHHLTSFVAIPIEVER